MNRAMNTAMRAAGKVAVFLYRRSGGRVGGKAAGGTPVLLLTVRGRRTGTPRTTPISYVEHAGGYVVIGSAAGLPDDPQWFKNLRKASQADIEVGRTRRTVDVRVLTGEERDRVWREVVLARAPVFERYVHKSGRTMPLAILTPVG